jgi:hypothetical protein
VVVTNLDPASVTAQQAMDRFKPFLEKHYTGKYKLNDRSYGIELSLVDLDLVITAKPNDADLNLLKSYSLTEDFGLDEVKTFSLKTAGDDGWKEHPLQIPDRRLAQWQPTHPLAQIQWTWDKNSSCNGHYVNVVKAIKWWRRVNHSTPKYPKGYPLEHIIGQCCPDGIESVADGVTRTMEEIASRYAGYAAAKIVPNLNDHGVNQNVLHRVSGDDFSKFHGQVQEAAKIARGALDETSKRRATEQWRKLFGDKFDLAETDDESAAARCSGGYSERDSSTTLGGGRWG